MLIPPYKIDIHPSKMLTVLFTVFGLPALVTCACSMHTLVQKLNHLHHFSAWLFPLSLLSLFLSFFILPRGAWKPGLIIPKLGKMWWLDQKLWYNYSIIDKKHWKSSSHPKNHSHECMYIFHKGIKLVLFQEPLLAFEIFSEISTKSIVIVS